MRTAKAHNFHRRQKTGSGGGHDAEASDMSGTADDSGVAYWLA